MKPQLKLVVGLGNPGLQYLFTRHNAGFAVVEQLAIGCNAHFSAKRSFYCDLAKAQLGGCDVLLAKPQTYMNVSGKAVVAILNWYKLMPGDLMVIHDDVSLPLGKIRLQKNGGAGGQHGVESIIEHLGGRKDFDRLKLGVGPDPGGFDRADYVLAPVPQEQRELFERSVTTSAEAVISWLENGLEKAMNQFNGLELGTP